MILAIVLPLRVIKISSFKTKSRYFPKLSLNSVAVTILRNPPTICLTFIMCDYIAVGIPKADRRKENAENLRYVMRTRDCVLPARPGRRSSWQKHGLML